MLAQRSGTLQCAGLAQRWGRPLALVVILPFLALDLVFFGANILRVVEGGWVPLWYVGSGGFGSVGNVTNMLSSITTTSASSSGSGYGGGSSGGGGGAGGGF